MTDDETFQQMKARMLQQAQEELNFHKIGLELAEHRIQYIKNLEDPSSPPGSIV